MPPPVRCMDGTYMRARLLLPGFLLLCGLLAIPGGLAKGPLFFESILVQEDAGDFSENGALDLDAAYVAERYEYDPAKEAGRDIVTLRIVPRALLEINNCLVQTPQASYEVCQVRYDAHFRVDGVAHDLFAVVRPAGDARCCPVAASNTAVVFDGAATSLSFLLDRTALGLFPGATLDHVFVTTQLVSQDQSRPADRAPGDNGNVPYDQTPELDGLYGEPYAVRGTYPFFEIAPETDLQLDSVNGNPVRFRFQITPAADVHDDVLRIKFDAPGAWSIIPDRGTSGADPTGLLTDLEENVPAHFSFTASPNDVIDEGTSTPITMRVYSSSGGFERVPLVVRTTGPLVQDPDYRFAFDAPADLRAGREADLVIHVLDAAGAPRTGLPLEVSFLHDGRSKASVPAEARADGYHVTYKFPSVGAWTVEAKVLDLTPAPHGATEVQVGAASAVPGPALPLTLLLLGLVALAQARRR